MNLGASKVQWKCRGAQAFALHLQSLSAMGIAAVGQGFTGLGVVFGPQSGGGILALRLSPVLLTFLVRGNVIFLHPPPTRPVKFWPVGVGRRAVCCSGAGISLLMGDAPALLVTSSMIAGPWLRWDSVSLGL